MCISLDASDKSLQHMTIPDRSQLTDAIADATRAAVTELFREHPGTYYYVTLFSSGDAAPCALSAWSYEALSEYVDPDLKWSCIDSPFCYFGWDKYFGHVSDLFANRPVMNCNNEKAWNAEYAFRYGCMEAAMARLDSEGLFGTGAARNNMVIAVEVMPPDYSNTEHVCRLNPPEAVADWLAEAAEY
ncbi:DUF4303 domain-containing protein [Endozoicomonadaceae bacterium StTr2]